MVWDTILPVFVYIKCGIVRYMYYFLQSLLVIILTDKTWAYVSHFSTNSILVHLYKFGEFAPVTSTFSTIAIATQSSVPVTKTHICILAFLKKVPFTCLSLSVLWFQLSGDYLVNETFPYTLYDALKEKKPQFLYTLDLIL